VSATGADHEKVVEYLNKSAINPGQIVTSASLGADKIGYLWMDRYLTGFQASGPQDWRAILPFLAWDEEGLAIEEKGVDVAKGFQQLYSDMWTRVYYRKAAVGAGRVLQKAIELWLKDTNHKPSDLWEKPEYWIHAQLDDAKDADARELHSRITQRKLLKSAVVFKPNNKVVAERQSGKNMSVQEVGLDVMRRYTEVYHDALRLTQTEDRIANILKLKRSEVILTLPPYPEKLIPKDIRILNNQGNNVGYLFGIWPLGKQKLEEEGVGNLAVRVMVPQKERQKASLAWKEIKTIIDEDCSHD